MLSFILRPNTRTFIKKKTYLTLNYIRKEILNLYKLKVYIKISYAGISKLINKNKVEFMNHGTLELCVESFLNELDVDDFFWRDDERN